MAVTKYLTVNGVLVGETGPNGVVNYHTDALGSIVMTSDANGNVLNQYRYRPFGSQKSKTGTAPDPAFKWAGSVGYRQTQRVHSEIYVRARHYGYLEGGWTTVDPLWPRERPFGYVSAGVARVTDRTGLARGSVCCTPTAMSAPFTPSYNTNYTFPKALLPCLASSGSSYKKTHVIPNFVGAIVNFTFNWTISDATATQVGGPCSLSWEEILTPGPGKTYNPNYQNAYTSFESCQYNNCVANNIGLGKKTCPVMDAPGFANGSLYFALMQEQPYYGDSIDFEVCHKFTQTGSCGVAPLISYYKTTVQVDYPGLGNTPTKANMTITVAPSNANCAVSKTFFV